MADTNIKFQRVCHRDDPLYDKIVIELEERYKQSTISGDEWRFGNRVRLFYKGKELDNGLMHSDICITLEKLAEQIKLLEPLDSSNNNKQFDDICCQPGCAERGTRKYVFKKIFPSNSFTGAENVPDANGYTKGMVFCDAHGKRGNCGLTDADDNYICIEGNDWTSAPVEDAKRSQSAGPFIIGVEDLGSLVAEISDY